MTNNSQSARMPVLVSISRAEVERGDITGPLEALRTLSGSSANVRNSAQSLLVAFNGYDDDPRELSEIPEVRLFFRRISVDWSYWAHFIYPDPDMVRILVLLAIDSEHTMGFADRVCVSVDLDDVDDVLLKWRSGLDRLHSRFGINPTLTEQVWGGIVNALPPRE